MAGPGRAKELNKHLQKKKDTEEPHTPRVPSATRAQPPYKSSLLLEFPGWLLTPPKLAVCSQLVDTPISPSCPVPPWSRTSASG
jgi:hypothetical protein